MVVIYQPQVFLLSRDQPQKTALQEEFKLLQPDVLQVLSLGRPATFTQCVYFTVELQQSWEEEGRRFLLTRVEKNFTITSVSPSPLSGR